MCVCVCQPLGQGFAAATSTTTFPPCITCRGVQHLWSTARNEATTTDGKGSRTLDPVPADQHIDTNGPPCRCSLVPWFFFTILPPNRFPTAAFSRLCIAASRASETMLNSSNHRTLSPFRSLTILLNVGIEVTEYNCQSVFRSAVPLGC